MPITPVSMAAYVPGAEHRVEAGDDAVRRVAERVDAGRVLDLVEADDVGVEAGERREQLVALARELVRLVGVGAAALECWLAPHLLSSGSPVG